MARKLSFNQDIILDKIMIYFWKNGFEATGFRELNIATGIKTQSLYNTFGNKNELFYQALNRYVSIFSQLSTQIIQSNKTPEQKLRDLLIFDTKPANYPQGCLVVNSLAKLDQIDPRLTQVANKQFDELTTNFTLILNSMKHELRAGLPIKTLASELLLLHNGIQQIIRNPKESANIHAIVATTIKSLKKDWIMMKLTFDNKALNKINQLKDTQDDLVLDLDDGIGEFSDYLSQNGLKYNLFITPSQTVPVAFSNVLMSNAGKIYFNYDTELTLDQNMQVIFDYHTSTFQLRSTNTLLEPNFQISKKSPVNDVVIR